MSNNKIHFEFIKRIDVKKKKITLFEIWINKFHFK